MGTRSHFNQRDKKPSSTTSHSQLPVRSRPFAVPAQPETSQAEPPDLQTQLETASRLGHSFSKISASTPAIIQPKLTIGAPDDKYEQEADRVAAQVVQQIQAPAPSQTVNDQAVQRVDDLNDDNDLQRSSVTETIQRVGDLDDDDDDLQMKPTVQRATADGAMAAPAELETAIQRSRGSGQPLAESIREPMEQAFSADFSGVKVHTDAQSDHLNRSIQAKAFTTGQDVFFRQGAYQPRNRGGQELIAHELTHVVQQSGVPSTLQRGVNASKELPTSTGRFCHSFSKTSATTPFIIQPKQTNTQQKQQIGSLCRQDPGNTLQLKPGDKSTPLASQPAQPSPQKPALEKDPKDQQRVHEFLQTHPSWGSVKDQFISDAPTMQAFVDYRKWYVDEIIGILRATKYPGLIAKSVGSNDLSSDYDITVSTPGDGDDVEAVSDFNQMVKNEFKVQPGTLFDTNLYAKDFLRVEGNIKQDPNLKQDVDLDQPDDEMGKLSNLDQDVAALVKQRRFMNPVEWDKYTKAVVSSIKNSDERKAVLKQYEEADAIYQISAHELLANTKESLGKEKIDLSKVQVGKEEQEELNKLPIAARKMVEKQLIGAEELHLITHENPDLILEQSNKLYVQRMRQVRQLQEQIKIVYGIPEEVRVLKAEVKKLLGEACFFAAEAYHSEGAVKHVVAGLQGGDNKQAALDKLAPEHILQSYNEQLGDFLKDAVHYSTEPAGKMFYRSSKYLFRLFDAVNEIKKRKEFKGIVLAVGDPADLAGKIDKELVAIRKGKAPYSDKSDEEKNAAAVKFVNEAFGADTNEGLKQKVLNMSIEFNQQVRNIVSSVADQKESGKYFKYAQIGNSDRK